MIGYNPFAGTYLTVTIPLDDAMVEALANSEQYTYLLHDLYSAEENTAYVSAYITLTVAFDFMYGETYFSINTICRTADGTIDSSSDENIELDAETADYFKAEALKHLAKNFKAMQKCSPARVAVPA